MRTTIKTTNMSLTPELREYALEKISSLERFFKGVDPDAVTADIELSRISSHHRKGEIWRCEVNVTLGKKLIRSEEQAETIKQAIDQSRDEIHQEVKKWQDKNRTRLLRSARKRARQFKFFRFRK